MAYKESDGIKMTAESLIAHLGVRLCALQEMTFLPEDVAQIDPVGYRALIMAKIFLTNAGEAVPEEVEKWLEKIDDCSIH